MNGIHPSTSSSLENGPSKVNGGIVDSVTFGAANRTALSTSSSKVGGSSSRHSPRPVNTQGELRQAQIWSKRPIDATVVDDHSMKWAPGTEVIAKYPFRKVKDEDLPFEKNQLLRIVSSAKVIVLLLLFAHKLSLNNCVD